MAALSIAPKVVRIVLAAAVAFAAISYWLIKPLWQTLFRFLDRPVQLLIRMVEWLFGRGDFEQLDVRALTGYSILLGLGITVVVWLLVNQARHPWLLFVAIGASGSALLNAFSAINLALLFVALLVYLFLLAQTWRQMPGSSWTFKGAAPQLPVLTIIFVLAFTLFLHALLPNDFFYNKDLNKYLRNLTENWFRDPGPIGYYEFNLASAGYYPEQNRLGGSVTASEIPFMLVETDAAPLYLRGAAFSTYTGLAWIQEPMEPNWRFGHPDNRSQQQDVYQGTLPLNESRALSSNSVPRTKRTYTVIPLAPETQVVFTTGALLDLTGAVLILRLTST